jgi:aminomethyltransferase
MDLSFRGRLCLTGADRARFLHGQVTQDIKALKDEEGCYAALVNAKGRMESDLNVWRLANELLLDFEPGLSDVISRRLNQYLVADDVQVVDASSHYGLLSVQGPKAESAAERLGLENVPARAFQFTAAEDGELGEVYLMNNPRLGSAGFDWFVPAAGMPAAAARLFEAGRLTGGRWCGRTAFETARVEAGVPRFPADMDGANLPNECIEERAVSFTKGCYIGQEILNRVHTAGHVARRLRGLRVKGRPHSLPAKGDKLFHAGKEAGYVTSAVESWSLNCDIALGYVREDGLAAGTELVVRTAHGDCEAMLSVLPFRTEAQA